MIWKSNYIRGMRGITLRRRTKKAPVLREETKRGQKLAKLLVDQNDRI